MSVMFYTQNNFISHLLTRCNNEYGLQTLQFICLVSSNIKYDHSVLTVKIKHDSNHVVKTSTYQYCIWNTLNEK